MPRTFRKGEGITSNVFNGTVQRGAQRFKLGFWKRGKALFQCIRTLNILAHHAVPLSGRYRVTDASGMRLSRGRRGGIVDAQLRRMGLAAANDVIVLMRTACFLASKAKAAGFDARFYAVHALELTAGAVDVVLLSLNLRDL